MIHKSWVLAGVFGGLRIGWTRGSGPVRGGRIMAHPGRVCGGRGPSSYLSGYIFCWSPSPPSSSSGVTAVSPHPATAADAATTSPATSLGSALSAGLRSVKRRQRDKMSAWLGYGNDGGYSNEAGWCCRCSSPWRGGYHSRLCANGLGEILIGAVGMCSCATIGSGGSVSIPKSPILTLRAGASNQDATGTSGFTSRTLGCLRSGDHYRSAGS